MTQTKSANASPSLPKTRMVVRVLGGLDEILEGHGVTRRGVPFELPKEFAERLVAEGPTYEFPQEA